MSWLIGSLADAWAETYALVAETMKAAAATPA